MNVQITKHVLITFVKILALEKSVVYLQFRRHIVVCMCPDGTRRDLYNCNLIDNKSIYS